MTTATAGLLGVASGILVLRFLQPPEPLGFLLLGLPGPPTRLDPLVLLGPLLSRRAG